MAGKIVVFDNNDEKIAGYSADWHRFEVTDSGALVIREALGNKANVYAIPNGKWGAVIIDTEGIY